MGERSREEEKEKIPPSDDDAGRKTRAKRCTLHNKFLRQSIGHLLKVTNKVTRRPRARSYLILFLSLLCHFTSRERYVSREDPKVEGRFPEDKDFAR